MKVFLLAGLLALAGCKFNFDSDKPMGSASECWDAGIKVSASGLAQTAAKNAFVKSLPNTLLPADADGISASFSFSLKNFFVTSYDPLSGSATCGAVYSFSYSRPDGSSYSENLGETIKFEVFQGENGMSAFQAGVDMLSTNFQYDPNANDSAPTP